MNKKINPTPSRVAIWSISTLILFSCLSSKTLAEQVCLPLTVSMQSDIMSADNSYKTFEECKNKLSADIASADEKAINSLKTKPNAMAEALKNAQSQCAGIGGKLSTNPERIDFIYIPQRRLCNTAGGDISGWVFKTYSWAWGDGIYQCCYDKKDACR